MYSDTYHRASSVDEAAALFAKGEEAKYLAGGQTLLPVMKQRLAAPSDVIDLARIKELNGIEFQDDAMTSRPQPPITMLHQRQRTRRRSRRSRTSLR